MARIEEQQLNGQVAVIRRNHLGALPANSYYFVVETIISPLTITVAWLPGIALLAYLLTNARAQNETTIIPRMTRKPDSFPNSVAFGPGTAVACLKTRASLNVPTGPTRVEVTVRIRL